MKILVLFTDQTKEHYPTIDKAITEGFRFLELGEPKEVELEEGWYNEATEQYDANKILEELGDRFDKPFIYLIHEDLYVNGMNFIFGRAVPYSGSVLSIKRLRTDNKELFKERIRKEAKHEIGHIFDLTHCTSECVMRFSNSVEAVDRKPEDFCISCKEKLKDFEG